MLTFVGCNSSNRKKDASCPFVVRLALVNCNFRNTIEMTFVDFNSAYIDNLVGPC